MNKYDTLRLLENDNPMIKLIVLGRMKRMINSYSGDKLKDIDKKLVRGVYLRNIKDFQEDYDEIRSNKTLLARLNNDMKIDPEPEREGRIKNKVIDNRF